MSTAERIAIVRSKSTTISPSNDEGTDQPESNECSHGKRLRSESGPIEDNKDIPHDGQSSN